VHAQSGKIVNVTSGLQELEHEICPRGGRSGSEKIPQSPELNDVLARQDGAHQRRLWRGMYFVQVARGHRLGHEFPYALIKGAVDDQIGARTCLGTTFVAE
jgi:hypothetical protein